MRPGRSTRSQTEFMRMLDVGKRKDRRSHRFHTGLRWMRAGCLGALVILMCAAVSSQERRGLPEDPVARVGNETITAADLLRRMELMPFPDALQPGRPDAAKRKALYALIAERVLANEARRQHLAEDETTLRMRRELENLFIRDELFKREVERKAEPREADIREGLRRFTWEVTVVSYLVRTEEDGKRLANELRHQGEAAMPKDIFTALVTERDTIRIHFDGPDSSFENAAYAIGEGGVSATFRSSKLGWAVLSLIATNPYRIAEHMKPEEQRRHVEQALRRRIETELQDLYARKILATRTALADSAVFNLFADSLIAMWKSDPAYFHRKEGYVVTSDMIDLLIDRLMPFLGRTYVHIEDGDLTLAQVLEMLRYEDFLCAAYEGWEARRELNEEVKHVVGRELLAREGRRLHLESSKPVQADLAMWEGFWAARALTNRVRDTLRIGDEEILDHFVRNVRVFGASYEVNIREILCKDIQRASAILDSLRRGRSLEALATECSLRRDWAERGGESGYFAVADHPVLGFRALLATSGGLQGPFQLDGGYSLFLVLGTRRTKQAITGFDTLRRHVAARLLDDKRRTTMDRYVASLARDENVSVDEDGLKKIHPTMVPMFTRRFMGFGGMMSATPILLRQWEWYDEFKRAAMIIP
jgi:hypothetical protein